MEWGPSYFDEETGLKAAIQGLMQEVLGTAEQAPPPAELEGIMEFMHEVMFEHLEQHPGHREDHEGREFAHAMGGLAAMMSKDQSDKDRREQEHGHDLEHDREQAERESRELFAALMGCGKQGGERGEWSRGIEEEDLDLMGVMMRQLLGEVGELMEMDDSSTWNEFAAMELLAAMSDTVYEGRSELRDPHHGEKGGHRGDDDDRHHDHHEGEVKMHVRSSGSGCSVRKESSGGKSFACITGLVIMAVVVTTAFCACKRACRCRRSCSRSPLPTAAPPTAHERAIGGELGAGESKKMEVDAPVFSNPLTEADMPNVIENPGGGVALAVEEKKTDVPKMMVTVTVAEPKDGSRPTTPADAAQSTLPLAG